MTQAKSLDGHGAFRGEREAQGAPAGEVGARESEEIGPEQRLCAPGSARQIRGWEPVRRPGARVWDRRGPRVGLDASVSAWNALDSSSDASSMASEVRRDQRTL